MTHSTSNLTANKNNNHNKFSPKKPDRPSQKDDTVRELLNVNNNLETAEVSELCQETDNEIVTDFVYSSNLFQKVREAYLKENK